MIAMQYTIRLAGDFDTEKIRERAHLRCGLFAGLGGLIHKSYLFNPEEAVYAPFYVWENEKPAVEFLTHGLFQDLVETFGRPRVRCWNVLAFDDRNRDDSITHALKEVDIISPEDRLGDVATRERAHHDQAIQSDDIGIHLVAFDPDRWELIRYTTWAGCPAPDVSSADLLERYEVLKLSAPMTATS